MVKIYGHPNNWIRNGYVVDSIEEADIIMFPGGSDINTALYGGPSNYPHNWGGGYNSSLYEENLYRQRRDIKQLCVGCCKGGQFLTAMAGGKLIQHVEKHANGSHSITTSTGETFHITSCHHQMMNPFMMNPKHYDILGWSSVRRSKVYYWGNELIEEPPVEPEIIYYKNINALAIQGHPEWMNESDPVVIYLNDFIEQILSKNSMIKIGADPEVFLVDSSGKVVSAIGIIPGTKEEPHKIGKGYAIQTDNILAEYNIPPATSQTEFLYSINYMKDYINNFVAKRGLQIKCSASEIVESSELQSDEAKLIGCSPDFCAYTLDRSETKTTFDSNLRSAGFHIHIGLEYTEHPIEYYQNLIILMDKFVGSFSLLVDKDVRRRELYGKAGSFRLTPYGCEYRVLSSFMQSCDEYIKAIYDLTMISVLLSNVSSRINTSYRSMINDGNVELAAQTLFANLNLFRNHKESLYLYISEMLQNMYPEMPHDIRKPQDNRLYTMDDLMASAGLNISSQPEAEGYDDEENEEEYDDEEIEEEEEEF